MRLFRDHSFGIGFIGEDSSIAANYMGALRSRMAPFFWTTIAGIIGLIIQITIIFHLLKNIIIKRVMIYNKIERYISISLVARILHHCLAGD